MFFCSQTLSPAPTERRPPTFGWGRGLPFETRSGFRYGAGSVPRIHLFWTRRAPWIFALKPFPRRRRSVALQLLDGGAVCLSKPVPGSATNGAGVGSVLRIHSFWTRRAPWFFALKLFLRRRRSVALQLLWRTRFAFRNPFRVPLRTWRARGRAGSVPRIHMFWTRRAPWIFALKPFLRRRRSVALQLLDGDAVCLSKPVPGSATNVAWRARGQSCVFTCFGLEGRRGFLLSNPFSGADGASPSNFCGGRGLPFETRSGFRYERDLGS
jgi:hypothetical protein